ncbi:MAG: M20 family metallo-hydrolase [Firmicutes bacterium]|nr:M20 family metallo-hydrolase [Bacillota bacterium]
MSMRADALKTAVEVLSRWYDQAADPRGFVYNIGRLDVHPGSVAVVPGLVEFVLELRSTDDNISQLAVQQFSQLLGEYSNCHMELIVQKPAVKLSSSVINEIEKSCTNERLSYKLMPSGASHDASPIAHFLPTGMIFVPSVGGISHSKDEYTAMEDIARGVRVLARTLEKLSNSIK